MDNKKKKEIFKNLKEHIESEINVCEIKYGENNMGYSLTGTLFKGMELDYSIRKKGNIAICKITTGLKSHDGSNLEVVAKDLAEPIEMIFTSYDGKYVFQKVISFTDDEDNLSVENNLKKSIDDIIGMIMNNQENFDIELNGNVIKEEADKESDETEDKEENIAEDNDDAEIEEDEGKEITEETKETEKTEEDKDNQINQVAEAISEIVNRNETHDKKDDKSKEESQTGIFSKFMPAQRSRHKKRTKVSKEDMINKAAEIKKDNKKEDALVNENAEEVKEQQTENNKNEEYEPAIAVMTEISARLSEETMHDIDTMYNDVTKLFDKKSKEADARQNLLDKYAKRLKQQEIEIEIQKKQNEKEMTKKEIELEKDKKEHHEKLEKEYTQKLLELETNYSAKESELHEMEMQYSQRKEEIVVDQKKLDLEWKKLRLALDELEKKKEQIKEMVEIKDKLGISGDDAEYQELEAAYDKLQEEYNTLVEENNEIIDENDKLADYNEKLAKKCEELNQKYEKLNTQYKSMQSDTEENKQLISKYEAEINELKTKASGESNTDFDTSEYEEKISKLEKERDNFRETAEELRNKDSENNSMYLELDDKYKKALEQIKILEEKNANAVPGEKVEMDLGQKAANVRDELSKIGVNVEVVVGAGDTILSTTYNNCRVCINVKCDILYIEKPVKKPQKYAKTFEEWNVEDIRIAYLTTADKVICKYAYDDVLKATKETLDRMEGIA